MLTNKLFHIKIELLCFYQQQLFNRKLNEASVKHLLCVLMRNSENLTRDQFVDFYLEVMSEVRSRSRSNIRQGQGHLSDKDAEIS